VSANPSAPGRTAFMMRDPRRGRRTRSPPISWNLVVVVAAVRTTDRRNVTSMSIPDSRCRIRRTRLRRASRAVLKFWEGSHDGLRWKPHRHFLGKDRKSSTFGQAGRPKSKPRRPDDHGRHLDASAIHQIGERDQPGLRGPVNHPMLAEEGPPITHELHTCSRSGSPKEAATPLEPTTAVVRVVDVRRSR